MQDIVWENAVYTSACLVEFYFSIAGHLKQSNETPTSI